MGSRLGLRKRFVNWLIAGARDNSEPVLPPPTPTPPDEAFKVGGFAYRSRKRRMALVQAGHAFLGPNGQPTEIAAAIGPVSELGITGLSATDGMISDDYNSELSDLTTRMQRFEEMRRSDPAMAVIENLISLPCRAAKWRLEPGDDPKFAKRLWQDMQDGMSHSFDELLRQALLAPLYGFTVHEIVGQQKADGFEGIRKFAERGRQTIERWKFDQHGGVQGLEQEGYRLDNDYYVNIKIPIERLVIWTWREDCGNPEGLGVFRQAYKPIRIGEQLQEMAGMRVERTCIPYPVWTPPSFNLNQADRDLVLALCDRMLAGENVGIIEPLGWKLRLEWGGPADVPFQDMIEWMHMTALQSVLGQFAGFGSGQSSAGSGNAAESATIFMENMNAISDWVCETFNRHVIPKVMEWNRGTRWLKKTSVRQPKLAHSRVGMRNLDAFGRLIRAIMDRNTLMVPDLMSSLLEQAGLPPLSKEDLTKICDMKNSNAALNSRGIKEQPGDGQEQQTNYDSPASLNGVDNALGVED